LEDATIVVERPLALKEKPTKDKPATDGLKEVHPKSADVV